MICRHFGPCGGCQLQHVAYAAQLQRKRERLAALLRAGLGRGAPPVRPVIGMQPSPDGMPWHFRHKASFVFGPASGRGRGLVMGHYAAGSQAIVPVVECPVHATRANRLAFALRDRLAHAGIPAAGPSLDGLLRYVIVRTTRDEREAVVMLVVTRNDRSLRAPLRAFLAGDEPPDGLLVNVHDRPGPFMVGRDTSTIAGRSQVRERVFDMTYMVSPTAFFQTNVEAAEVLARLVTDAVSQHACGRPLRVVDLYAGSGLFSLPLARAGHLVTAIEENAQAVRDAEANRRLNRIPAGHLHLVRSRVEDALVRLTRSAPDLVVLDPPRQGTPAAVIRAVFEAAAPPVVVYVSCNPTAFATELPAIARAGYTADPLQPVDMFPHTSHTEVVAVLHRGRAGATEAVKPAVWPRRR